MDINSFNPSPETVMGFSCQDVQDITSKKVVRSVIKYKKSIRREYFLPGMVPMQGQGIEIRNCESIKSCKSFPVEVIEVETKRPTTPARFFHRQCNQQEFQTSENFSRKSSEIKDLLRVLSQEVNIQKIINLNERIFVNLENVENLASIPKSNISCLRNEYNKVLSIRYQKIYNALSKKIYLFKKKHSNTKQDLQFIRKLERKMTKLTDFIYDEIFPIYRYLEKYIETDLDDPDDLIFQIEDHLTSLRDEDV